MFLYLCVRQKCVFTQKYHPEYDFKGFLLKETYRPAGKREDKGYYRNPLELDKYLREKTAESSTRYYVMIDEVQEVRPIPNPWLDDENEKIGFVDVLLGLMDFKNIDLYVTGSNSKMLSTDIMTEFKDRGDEIHVEPLMYKEFYDAFDGDRATVWQEFTMYGGLPRILSEKTDEDKSSYLQNLIRKTYLGFFEEVYLIRNASRYDIKGKKYIGTPTKYYFTDIGLRNAQLNFSQQEETASSHGQTRMAYTILA